MDMESNNRNRNSMRIDLEEVRLTDLKNENLKPKETYKKLDSNGLDVGDTTVNNSNMSRDIKVEDGADERMLASPEENGGAGGDDSLLTGKEPVIKLIPMGASEKNGDAKIDMKSNEPEVSFTGMTKDELMKYANDPFWIRLRWILFVAFWALWVAMLVGAIYIIVKAPKCSAPQPLVWYKEGPLIVLPADAAQLNADYVGQVKKLDGKAVIYEVPGDDTYFLQDKQAEKIKSLVEQFKGANVKVVVDLTPNYVLATDPLFEKFVADESQRTAFAWQEGRSPPTDWLNRNNTSAWLQHDKFQVLSHYGAGRFDLNMSSEVAKDKFKGVLQQLVDLGVRGVRLNNAKHYIISGEKKNDVIRKKVGGSNFTENEYGFYEHSYNTFQPGLGELIHEYANYVHNATGGDGFVSVNENLIDPKHFELQGSKMLAVDIPQYGFLPNKLETGSPHQIYKELERISSSLPDTAWPQWIYTKDSYAKELPGSEFNTFLMLLKGVPVAPLDAFAYSNHSEKFVADLTLLRKSACFMHGDLQFFTSANDTSVGYTRFKSGNPGYFVALNPTENKVEADFSAREDLPDELTVSVMSENYNVEGTQLKSKMAKNKVHLSPKSAVIFTYVPKG